MPTTMTPPNTPKDVTDIVTEHNLARPTADMPPDLVKFINDANGVFEAALDEYDREVKRINDDRGLTDIGRSDRRAAIAERVRWSVWRNGFVPTLQMMDRFAERLELPGEDDRIGPPPTLTAETRGPVAVEVRERLRELRDAERMLAVKAIAARTDHRARVVVFAVDSDPLSDTPVAIIKAGDLKTIREIHHRALHPEKFASSELLGHAKRIVSGNFTNAQNQIRGGQALPAIWQQKLSDGTIPEVDYKLAAYVN